MDDGVSAEGRAGRTEGKTVVDVKRFDNHQHAQNPARPESIAVTRMDSPFFINITSNH